MPTHSIDHLNALQLRLSHERIRLANAKSANEIALRKVWIAGIEKEIQSEMKFLELATMDEILMSDDELLAELS